MKNKIAIASAAFIAASSASQAEIVINDFLSFEGFVDMSYTHVDGEYDSDAYGSESYNENSFAIDQVEISWLFDFDTVTAQVDLEYEEAGDDLEVEQAFASYHFGDGAAITAGRYASMLGFEAFEPTGLYQYSFAYDMDVLPGYNQGVKFTQESENTFFGISIQDTVTGEYEDALGGDNGGWGVEVAGSYFMDNGVSFFLGGAYEDGDYGDTYILNSYVTYETGDWIFAAELNYGETEWDGNYEFDVLSGLVMASYAYSDQGSVTGRVSFMHFDEDGYGDEEFVKFTLAHGWAFTDNLLLVTEVSYADGEWDDEDSFYDEEFDYLLGAVELLFTF